MYNVWTFKCSIMYTVVNETNIELRIEGFKMNTTQSVHNIKNKILWTDRNLNKLLVTNPK